MLERRVCLSMEFIKLFFPSLGNMLNCRLKFSRREESGKKNRR